MSFAQVELSRREAAESILQKFAAGIDRAEQNAALRAADPRLKKLASARVALEYAVLATAREKNIATQVVAAHLDAATTAQQAAMVREGSAALGRVYGVEPDVLVNALVGKIVHVEMPRSLASTPEIDQMVDTCRCLAMHAIKDEYAMREPFSAGSYDKSSFIALRSDGGVSPAKSELASRMAFMESAFDAAVTKGTISSHSAHLLRNQIEAQVFQPRPSQTLLFSQEFNQFFEQRGKAMRIEAMKEVRSVTQSLQVQEIAAKLKLMMAATGGQRSPPVVSRAVKPLER